MKALAWAEVGANRKLRARLGLPLGRGGCRPVVGLLSSSWLLEEPQALEPHQVGRRGAFGFIEKNLRLRWARPPRSALWLCRPPV
jgi:hypothetical protein